MSISLLSRIYLKRSKSQLFCVNIRDGAPCLITGRFATAVGVVFLECARKPRVTENRPSAQAPLLRSVHALLQPLVIFIDLFGQEDPGQR